MSSEEVGPFLGVLLPLDMGLVIQFVLSLFVLLLTYDAVCGEKEAGTLRLIASFSVPRHRLLLAKLIGTLISTLFAFGLPLLLGVAVVLALPDVQFTSAELGRLGLVIAAFAIYLTTFISAGLLGSCLSHQPATSFVLLLTFWAFVVVVLPPLSLISADRIRPAPSVHEHETAQYAISQPTTEKQRDLRDQWKKEHLKPGQDEWNAPPEVKEAWHFFNQKISLDLYSRLNAQWDRLDDVFNNRYNARLDLAVALARFSPAFAFQNASVFLAGTGIDRHQGFFSAYKQHRKHYLYQYFFEIYYRDWLRKDRPEKYGKYKWDVSDLPRFNYREIWPDQKVQGAMVDIGVMALWGLLFFAGAYVAMLRYDLR